MVGKSKAVVNPTEGKACSATSSVSVIIAEAPAAASEVAGARYRGCRYCLSVGAGPTLSGPPNNRTVSLAELDAAADDDPAPPPPLLPPKVKRLKNAAVAEFGPSDAAVAAAPAVASAPTATAFHAR
jgi:hypothetical protein